MHLHVRVTVVDCIYVCMMYVYQHHKASNLPTIFIVSIAAESCDQKMINRRKKHLESLTCDSITHIHRCIHDMQSVCDDTFRQWP